MFYTKIIFCPEEETKEVEFISNIYTYTYIVSTLFVSSKINVLKLLTKMRLLQDGEDEYKFEWQKGAPREKLVFYVYTQ